MIEKIKSAYATVMTCYDAVIDKIVMHPNAALAIASVLVVGALLL